MTPYQVTKTITYTLVVNAQTPADAAIIADSHELSEWEQWSDVDLDVESLGPESEEIDEY
jgi:hypothetical protein